MKTNHTQDCQQEQSQQAGSGKCLFPYTWYQKMVFKILCLALCHQYKGKIDKLESYGAPLKWLVQCKVQGKAETTEFVLQGQKTKWTQKTWGQTLPVGVLQKEKKWQPQVVVRESVIESNF